jgi:hypothetical protein
MVKFDPADRNCIVNGHIVWGILFDSVSGRL